MREAYVFDALRTPRGKGKSDGALHEITPVQLATQMLEAVRDRNNLDTAAVDDVAFGCALGGCRHESIDLALAAFSPAPLPGLRADDGSAG